MRAKCTYEDCHREGKYALYQLNDDLTKVWRTDLCDEHEILISRGNSVVLKGQNIECFKEINK